MILNLQKGIIVILRHNSHTHTHNEYLIVQPTLTACGMAKQETQPPIQIYYMTLSMTLVNPIHIHCPRASVTELSQVPHIASCNRSYAHRLLHSELCTWPSASVNAFCVIGLCHHAFTLCSRLWKINGSLNVNELSVQGEYSDTIPGTLA